MPVSGLQWVEGSYSLVFGGLLLLGGRGRRPVRGGTGCSWPGSPCLPWPRWPAPWRPPLDAAGGQGRPGGGGGAARAHLALAHHEHLRAGAGARPGGERLLGDGRPRRHHRRGFGRRRHPAAELAVGAGRRPADRAAGDRAHPNGGGRAPGSPVATGSSTSGTPSPGRSGWRRSSTPCCGPASEGGARRRPSPARRRRGPARRVRGRRAARAGAAGAAPGPAATAGRRAERRHLLRRPPAPRPIC